MHTLTQLKSSMFEVFIDGRPGERADLLPDWHAHDRLGVVIHDPLGGVGASHLIQLAITAYYEARARRRGPLRVYPDVYAFHVGGGHGSHADFDIWPSRREVILGSSPQGVLSAINDHAITRLAVPDIAPHSAELNFKDYDAARDTIATSLVYSATGRTTDADIRVAGKDRRTELNPTKVLEAAELPEPPALAGNLDRPLKELDPEFASWLAVRARDLSPAEVAEARQRRRALVEDGTATETYRRVSVEDALARLVPTVS